MNSHSNLAFFSKQCLLLLLLSGIAGAWSSLVAQETEVGSKPVISNISVGTQRLFKVGNWTPVNVEFEISSPAELFLSLETIDSDGNPNEIAFPPVKFDSAGKHQLSGKYLPGRLEAGLTVRLSSEEGVLAAKNLNASESVKEPLPVAQKLSLFVVGLISADSSVQNSDVEGNSDNAESNVWFDAFKSDLELEETVKLVTMNQFSELPQESRTLELFDALILTDAIELSESESRLLANWVKKGGRLTLVLGGQEEKYQASDLSNWIPVSVEGTVTMREMGALENFVGKGKFPRGIFTTAKMTPQNSTVHVDVTNLEGPVLISSAYGFGQIRILGVDITDKLFIEWEGLSPFLYKLIGIDSLLAGEQRADSRGNLAKGGISDTRTQMQSTLEQFDNKSEISIWGIMARIMGLLLIIGPIDYLLVHYVLKRPVLTWITFPVFLVLASYWAVSATQASNMQEPVLRQVNILELDQSSGYSRTQSWQSFKVPESNQYDVQVAANLEQLVQPTRTVETVDEPFLSWSGTPEESFLGMYRTGGLSMNSPTYSFSDSRDSLQGIPVAKWSSKVIETEWTAQTSGLIESELRLGAGGKLVGNLAHHLPVPVTDWFVVYDGRVYRQLTAPKSNEVVPLNPHQRWVPNDPKVQRRILKQFLIDALDPTREKTVDVLSSSMEEQAEYNFKSDDPFYYFRTIAFRDFMGGRDHTRISNDVLKKFDLSEQMGLKRAILVGKIEMPVSNTRVNGTEIEPEFTETIVRILLPVEQTFDPTKNKYETLPVK